jgi:hypothetical protein
MQFDTIANLKEIKYVVKHDESGSIQRLAVFGLSMPMDKKLAEKLFGKKFAGLIFYQADDDENIFPYDSIKKNIALGAHYVGIDDNRKFLAHPKVINIIADNIEHMVYVNWQIAINMITEGNPEIIVSLSTSIKDDVRLEFEPSQLDLSLEDQE